MFITARIASIFVTSTAVHINDFHIFAGVIHHLEGLFRSNNLLAQFVERCTGIAKVMGSSPVQA